jgi:hypothetical protein
LLNRLEGEQPDAVLINTADATDPWQILQAIATRASVPRQFMSELSAPFQRIDPLAAPRALRDLGRALTDQDRHITVLLDGPIDPLLSNVLFGRLRDELFSLPMTWVVLAHEERMAQYLAPPADVFFEVVDRIDDLTDTDIHRLFALRGNRALAARLAREIADASDGTPRRALALARAQEHRPTADAMRDHATATAGLSRGASMLLAEMTGRSAVAVTDDDLKKRLGVSDRAVRRHFAELAERDLVEIVPGGRGQPGRPPTTFVLTPLGSFTQGELVTQQHEDPR